jgi:adenylate kinase
VIHHPPQREGICDECGGELVIRADDAPVAMRKRIKAFYKETFSLKNYFEKLGVLVIIPAEKSVSEVQAHIWKDALLG